VAQRFEDVRQEALAAEIEAFKNAKMQAYSRAGVGPAEFAKLWPGMLADYQRELANADPLAPEKDRLRSQADYSM
jgi:hypothetical protein